MWDGMKSLSSSYMFNAETVLTHHFIISTFSQDFAPIDRLSPTATAKENDNWYGGVTERQACYDSRLAPLAQERRPAATTTAVLDPSRSRATFQAETDAALCHFLRAS